MFARLPLLQHPLLSASLQQRPAVQGDRGLQGLRIARGQCGVEGDDIRLRAVQQQAEGVRGRRVEAPGFSGQRAAQVGQAVAQARQGLGIGAVGPQHPRQPGARHLGAVAQSEQGQEPVSLARAEAWQRLSVHLHVERSEESNRKGSVYGFCHRWNC